MPNDVCAEEDGKFAVPKIVHCYIKSTLNIYTNSAVVSPITPLTLIKNVVGEKFCSVENYCIKIAH